MTSQPIFGALANPARRRILEILNEESRSAGDIAQELAEEFDLRRPAVSEHLQVLREAGLVAEEVRGRQRIYSLNAEGLGEINAWLQPFARYWRGRLHALKRTLDKEKP